MTLVHAETGEVVVAKAIDGPLAALEHAHRLLVKAESVDEVKDIRDKAESLRHYARQQKLGWEMTNRCAELKLRAERRAGELLASDPDIGPGKSPTLGDLGLTYNQSSRWQKVASIPEPEFDAYIASAFLDEKELTTAGALKLAKRLAAADLHRPNLHVITPDDDNEPETTPDVFSAIVIDPPWRYDNVATRGAAEDHYPTMSLDELAALEVPADENAHLYLWVTNGFIEEGFALLRSWGFTYKTCLTWCKPQIGMGNWFRNSTEHVLFGVKGRLPTTANNVPTWFVADRTRHSAKPESFYDLVEKSSPGPYLEMFARRRRFGWHTWGNEA